MKRSWIFSTLVTATLLTILLAIFSQGNILNAGEMPENKDVQLTEHRRMMSSNNDFACNLFRATARQHRGNESIIMSPLSVSYMLGMLNAGADGKTREQITDVLRLDASVQEINEFLKVTTEKSLAADSSVTVRIANCINVNSAKGIKLIPQYKDAMHNYYNCQVEALDFTKASSVRHINNWCKTQTDGMIPSMIKEFNRNDVICMLNAVYFKASWTQKFDPKKTRDRNFTSQEGYVTKRPMMNCATEAQYAANDLCKMLCLPYGNKNYSMYVLLPNEDKTIDDIIQSLSAQKLEEWRLSMRTRKVDILIPRFTVECETSLIKVLSSLGMSLAFNEIDAEFPNMVENKDDLYVSMMEHKAKIEVDEKGTKATAVTEAMVSARSAVNFYVSFHATRPFVYYIMEESTGAIFFMGTYSGDVKEYEAEAIKKRGPVSKKEHEKQLEDKIFRAVEQMPRFPGGEAALTEFIDSHINYPPQAIKNGVPSSVIVQFVVEKDGSIGEVKVVRSVDKQLDKEAIRITKSLPRFTPGRQDGEIVRVWYTLPIPVCR